MKIFESIQSHVLCRSGAGARIGYIASVLSILLLPSALPAQVIESWEVYSALDRSTSVATAPDGGVWVGTTGGVYRYDPADGSTHVYRTDNALLDLSVTAVGVNPDNGDVYVGGADGTVSILRHEGWWTYVTDIARSSHPDASVRGFSFSAERTYILTSFGVVVYSPSDSTIRDSWTRLGSIIPNTGVNALVIYRDSIWVGSDSGLAVGAATGRDLADPLNWRVYKGGACGDKVLSLAVINGELNVGASEGACRLDDGAFLRRDDVGGPIRFGINGDRIVAGNESVVWRLESTGRFAEVGSSPRRMVSVGALGDGSIVGGMEQEGIVLWRGGSRSQYVPDGPVSNTFEDMTFGLDGSLWVGTGINGSGISRLMEGEWVNYTAEKTPGLTTNSSWRINADDQGRIWVGSFGDGMSILTPGEGSDVTVTHYDETNSPLRGISNAPEYTIVADAKPDGFGRTWFINWDDSPGNASRGVTLLAFARSESTGSEGFEQYSAAAAFPGLSSIRPYSRLVIDFNGTKWLASDRDNAGSLLFFNERGAENGGSKWGRVTTSNGLPSSIQTALLVDPDGELWIGTPQGLVVLVNPGAVMQNGSANAIFRTVRPLENVYIREIAVDALNRKWVGTNDGVVVLSSDGTEVLATYTEANSPLVDNQVLSILPNDATGAIYIGTVEGLNKVQTEAVRSEEITELTASPQPYVLPSAETLRIVGLPLNSSVKILTLSGTLVREFASPGGGIGFWDGRDGTGEEVSSGVYIIAAKSSLGETVIGKVAVVRK